MRTPEDYPQFMMADDEREREEALEANAYRQPAPLPAHLRKLLIEAHARRMEEDRKRDERAYVRGVQQQINSVGLEEARRQNLIHLAETDPFLAAKLADEYERKFEAS